MKILLTTIATEKYAKFLPELIRTYQMYFLAAEETKLLILNDDSSAFSSYNDFVLDYQIEHPGWPYVTLFRYKLLLMVESLILNYDYVYYIDADMKFASAIGKEILPQPGSPGGDASGLVATTHPRYYMNGTRGKFEQNPESEVYIPPFYSGIYYQACFWGGRTDAVLKMMEILRDLTECDLRKGVITRWWDEAYLNWYVMHNKPEVTLTPAYAWPEGRRCTYPKKIVHIAKDNARMRQPS